MEHDRLKCIVESLLFVSDGAVTLDRLSAAVEEPSKREIASTIEELRSEYEGQGRGFRLVEVAGGYQLRSAKENAPWVKNLFRGKGARMGRATLETLAIVAYKQPLTRAEVEQIRGVGSDGVLAALLERRLVKIVGRKEVPGRPFLYGTTRVFLEHFSLKDLSSLPTLKEIDELTLPQVGETENSPVESEP